MVRTCIWCYEVNKKFRILALEKHSEKGGNDADFTKLFDAWKAICSYYNNLDQNEIMKHRDGKEEDEEEKFVRQLFKDSNVCRQNQSSFTVFIENEFSFLWYKVLENRYGSPLDTESMVSTGHIKIIHVMNC